MDTNRRIIELKNAIVRETSATAITLPGTYWLNSNFVDVINRVELEVVDYQIEQCIFKFGEKNVQTLVENKEDFDNLLQKHRLTSELYQEFRIVLKSTKKWGMKPLFINTPNTVNFICMVKALNDGTYFLLYNLDGTKTIEAINIHGVWKICNNVP